jgi:hypothetical protein
MERCRRRREITHVSRAPVIDTGNPELSGPDAVDVLTYNSGWITDETEWVVPEDKWAETKDDIANSDDWPGVNWPMSEEGAGHGSQEGEGDWGDFHIGHGGFCDDIDPPAGYVGLAVLLNKVEVVAGLLTRPLLPPSTAVVFSESSAWQLLRPKGSNIQGVSGARSVLLFRPMNDVYDS